MRSVKIMIACGSGVATSMLAASIVKERLESERIPFGIDSTSVNSLPTRLTGVDIIVASCQVPFDTEGIAVFNAVPILTGIGRDELLDQIVAKAKEIGEG